MRVVIAGGGIAGLESLLALGALAGDRLAITLVSPDPTFLYKPMIVEEPFSAEPAEEHELAPLAAERGAEFVQQPLARVHTEEREAELGDGTRLPYDALAVCLGARAREAYEGAITFRVGGEPLAIDGILSDAERIAFLVPPAVTWALPIYELALMTRSRAERQGADPELCVYTPEWEPLAIFGQEASDAVAETLRARRIEVEVKSAVTEPGGRLSAGGMPIEADAAIALPALEGPSVEGLPADEGGFIPIDEHCRVPGLEGVYAAGDGTTFPIKQGGIATQQADAAAEHIAAGAGADVDAEAFHPILRGTLITGEESLHMRHEIGQAEGAASLDYLWWPPHKVSGRYLAPWLAGVTPHAEPEPPAKPIEVEVALPKEWHREPMALDPYRPIDG